MNDAILDQRWFHSIDLGGGVVTRGRFGRDVPPNYTLFGFFDLIRHIDLSAARAVDVGTMDGLAAFVLKELGAPHVLATDLSARPTFRYARDRLGLDVDYRTPATVRDLGSLCAPELPNLILLAGVLYHVPDPLTVLLTCRDALPLGGLLILETAFLYDEGRPMMAFNLSSLNPRRLETAHTYWRPSKSAVHAMLHLAAFEVLATRVVHGRLTVLAQAKRPSEVEGCDPRITRAQVNRDRHYRDIADFDAMEREPGSAPTVQYRGPRDDRVLHRSLFRPSVPFQPRWQPTSNRARAKDIAVSLGMQARMAAGDVRAWAGSRDPAP